MFAPPVAFFVGQAERDLAVQRQRDRRQARADRAEKVIRVHREKVLNGSHTEVHKQRVNRETVVKTAMQMGLAMSKLKQIKEKVQKRALKKKEQQKNKVFSQVR